MNLLILILIVAIVLGLFIAFKLFRFVLKPIFILGSLFSFALTIYLLLIGEYIFALNTAIITAIFFWIAGR